MLSSVAEQQWELIKIKQCSSDLFKKNKTKSNPGRLQIYLVVVEGLWATGYSKCPQVTFFSHWEGTYQSMTTEKSQ